MRDKLISKNSLLEELKAGSSSRYDRIVEIDDDDDVPTIISKTLTAYREILFELIDDLPEVYDISKVCDELESHKVTFLSPMGNGQYEKMNYVELDEAHDIVKGNVENGLRCNIAIDEYHGWECGIADGECMLRIPDEKDGENNEHR